MLVSAEKI